MSTRLDSETISVLKFVADGNIETIITSIYSRAYSISQLLYNLSVPEFIIQSIQSFDEITLIDLIDSLELNSRQATLFLLTNLEGNAGNTGWIHFNLSKHLIRLFDESITCAQIPAIIHSMLTIQIMRDQREALSLPLSNLYKYFLTLAPKLAVQQFLDLQLTGFSGDFQAIQPALRLLDVKLPAVGGPRANFREIASQLGLSYAQLDRFPTRSLESIEATPVFAAEIATLCQPPQLVDHYIFNSGNVIARKGVTQFAIAGGIISFDISKKGLTEYYVFDHGGVLIPDLSSGFNPFISDDMIVATGSVAVIDDAFSGSFNICHFLLDHVTRIFGHIESLAKPDQFLIFESYPYYDYILATLGAAFTFLRVSDSRFSLRASTLLILSNMKTDFCHPAQYCANWAVGGLRKHLLDPSLISYSRKIFISREDASGRRIANWSEVSEIVEQYGFEIVELGRISAEEQVSLFRSASHVMGVHGAGLTNIVFSGAETRVIEILPALVATPAYWYLASSLGQKYMAFVAKDPDNISPDYRTWNHDAKYNDRNVLVPPLTFAAFLELAMIS